MYDEDYERRCRAVLEADKEEPHLASKRGSVVDAMDNLAALIEEAYQLPIMLRQRLVRVIRPRPEKDEAVISRPDGGCDLSQGIRSFCAQLHIHNESLRSLLDEIDL